MKKRDAVELFGSVNGLAKAVGVSRQSVWLWPEDLEQRQTDLVVGAAVRLGKLGQLIDRPAPCEQVQKTA